MTQKPEPPPDQLRKELSWPRLALSALIGSVFATRFSYHHISGYERALGLPVFGFALLTTGFVVVLALEKIVALGGLTPVFLDT